MKKKKKNIFIGLAIVALLLAGIIYRSMGFVSRSEPSISASFYPLAEVAREVGKGQIEVHQIVPGAIEPHEYEPSIEDVKTIYGSSYFIYNGGEIDPWASKLVPELNEKNIPTRKAINTVPTKITDGQVDPHIWLDPTNMKAITIQVRELLIANDDIHASKYRANAQAYIEQLDALDLEYKTRLSTCAKNEAIVAHDAFNYLGNRYGITFISIAGLSPEDEPTPQKISELVELVKQRELKYVFFETLASPKLAQTIATEAGAETLVLNPIEGIPDEDRKNGTTYITLMKENLKNLSVALECQ